MTTELVEQPLPLDGEVVDAGQWTPQEAADYVLESYGKSIAYMIETGCRLNEVKAKVGHGNWLPTLELLPFGVRQAQRFMAIADHPDIRNASHETHLPASVYTLSVLAQLPTGEIPKRIEAGEITPELDRATAQAWVSTYSAARQEALNAWSQASDAALHVLSYLKTYGPPPDTDVYVTVSEFRRRVLEMATIVQHWEEPSE